MFLPMSTPTGTARWSCRTDPTWVAVIGIPLAAALGPRHVTVRDAGGKRDIEFTVGDKRYASQSLKVAPAPSRSIARRFEARAARA